MNLQVKCFSDFLKFTVGGSICEPETPMVYYNRDRRRSSFTRPMRDPEEILEGLRSLKAVKGELNRAMSFSSDKRRASREYRRFSASLGQSFRSYSSVRRPSVCLYLSLYLLLSIRSSHLSHHFYLHFVTQTFYLSLSLSLFFVTVILFIFNASSGPSPSTYDIENILITERPSYIYHIHRASRCM